MSPLRLNGSTSGNVSLDAPAVAGNNTLTLPTGNGSTYQIVRNGATAGSLEFADKIVSGTAVASTSGTSIDFTGIPSWVKRITVMFNGVSTSGTSSILVQLGAGSITSTGYLSYSCRFGGASVTGGVNFTTGFGIAGTLASFICSGSASISLLGSNTWTANGFFAESSGGNGLPFGGSIPLSGTLDRVRITTVNGTDTFDAGSINLLWE
jgi:hypothetical protein